MSKHAANYSAQDNLGYCLSRAALILQTAVDDALADLDLSRLSWTVLACICFDGVKSPSQIANFVGLERTTASRIISRLEKQGFVTRGPDSVDGRGHIVKPTRLGRDVSKQAPAIIQTATRPYLADLSENNEALLIDLLKRIGVGTLADWSTAIPKE